MSSGTINVNAPGIAKLLAAFGEDPEIRPRTVLRLLRKRSPSSRGRVGGTESRTDKKIPQIESVDLRTIFMLTIWIGQSGP